MNGGESVSSHVIICTLSFFLLVNKTHWEVGITQVSNCSEFCSCHTTVSLSVGEGSIIRAVEEGSITTGEPTFLEETEGQN